MTFRPKLAVAALFGTGLYVALAVAGEGGFHAFFDRPPLIALVLVTLLLVIASGFTSGNLSSGEREDRGNRWVLAVFGILGLLVGAVPAWTDRLGFAAIDGENVRWVGVFLYAVGGALRIWPVFVLGRRFSGLVAIQPGHTLVTTGIYKSIRNPSYLGLLINVVGWALAFRSIIGILLAVSMLIPLVPRMDSEEKLLSSQFGAEYDAYRSHTWRLIPRLY